MQRDRSNVHSRAYMYIRTRATWKVGDPARGRVSHCLSFSLSLLRVVVRAYVHVALCVYVRDRYAIARAPTESMKIKREYSSPSEVKDALECRTAPRPDTMQRHATRHDTMAVFSSPVGENENFKIYFIL